jgi:hypothetical protein
MILQELQSINHGSLFMVYHDDIGMSKVVCLQPTENACIFDFFLTGTIRSELLASKAPPPDGLNRPLPR